MNTTTEASKAAPATATLRLDQSVAKNLFFGEIVEENLFPYPVMRERDRELLGLMVDSIDRFLGRQARRLPPLGQGRAPAGRSSSRRCANWACSA